MVTELIKAYRTKCNSNKKTGRNYVRQRKQSMRQNKSEQKIKLLVSLCKSKTYLQGIFKKHSEKPRFKIPTTNFVTLEVIDVFRCLPEI